MGDEVALKAHGGAFVSLKQLSDFVAALAAATAAPAPLSGAARETVRLLKDDMFMDKVQSASWRAPGGVDPPGGDDQPGGDDESAAATIRRRRRSATGGRRDLPGVDPPGGGSASADYVDPPGGDDLPGGDDDESVVADDPPDGGVYRVPGDSSEVRDVEDALQAAANAAAAARSAATAGRRWAALKKYSAAVRCAAAPTAASTRPSCRAGRRLRRGDERRGLPGRARKRCRYDALVFC
ncbi:hypothetical protein JL720_12788 [Aureococcus anophagefferens]|nr:hypothetical protein JL720_12788 [Aureococcus anophagefferens]